MLFPRTLVKNLIIFKVKKVPDQLKNAFSTYSFFSQDLAIIPKQFPDQPKQAPAPKFVQKVLELEARSLVVKLPCSFLNPDKKVDEGYRILVLTYREGK